MKIHKHYCVSHQPPLLPEKFFDYAIGLGAYRPNRGSHISQIDPFWDEHRPVSYGAAGTYVLPRAITINRDQTELTGISQYRKIVVRPALGREAPNYPTMRLATLDELSKLDADEALPNAGCDFLVSSLRSFPQGVIGQYAAVHHIIDLLDYLSIAVQLGVMTASDVTTFSLERNFIPGGCEFGVFPTLWLKDALSKIESVGREFILRYGDRIIRYDAYQVRAVGFLSERLGSFLLIKELIRRYPEGIPLGVFGNMTCVVSAENGYSPGIT